MGTVVLLIYLAGCMGFLVPTARFFLNDTTFGEEPDNVDYAMAASMSLCIVWVWPLYIPGWWIVQMIKRSPRGGK